MDDVKSVKKVTMHPFVDQRGMTVPEILAAVVVIMVALVALASAIPISAYGIQEGSQLTTATFLANQRLEQVKLKQWTVKPTWTPWASPASRHPPRRSGERERRHSRTRTGGRPVLRSSRGRCGSPIAGLGAGCGGVVQDGAPAGHGDGELPTADRSGTGRGRNHEIGHRHPGGGAR